MGDDPLLEAHPRRQLQGPGAAIMAKSRGLRCRLNLPLTIDDLTQPGQREYAAKASQGTMYAEIRIKSYGHPQQGGYILSGHYGKL
jgi:hypothetical protein